MANLITALRILLIFPILLIVSDQDSIFNWVALSLFILAGITDHLDGYIARKTETVSSLGALLDLIADKLLICIPLLYLLSFSDNIPLILPAIIILSRELVISSLRQFLVQTYGNSPISVSFIAKAKTTIQITALSFLIISPNFMDTFYLVTKLLFWVAAFISVYSLFDYIKAYKNYIN